MNYYTVKYAVYFSVGKPHWSLSQYGYSIYAGIASWNKSTYIYLGICYDNSHLKFRSSSRYFQSICLCIARYIKYQFQLKCTLFRPNLKFSLQHIVKRNLESNSKKVKKFEKPTPFGSYAASSALFFASEALLTTLMLSDDKCLMPIKCSSDTFDLGKNASDESELRA